MKKKVVKNKMSAYCQQIFKLEGKPFSLEGRRHLDLVYNHNKKKTLYMFSRQAEKSTTLAAKSVGRSCLLPYFRTLYVSPRDAQVKTFSAQKLKMFVDMSPRVTKFFQNKNCHTGTFYKSFSNGSDYTLRSAYLSPDSCRGISADALYVDELQDVIRDHLPVIESALLHGKKFAKYKEYAGTPKSLQNHIEHEWQSSYKMEWVIKCSGCNNYNILGVKNIGLHHLICSRHGCGRQIFPIHGQWIVTNKEGKFPGFRICYLMTPWCVWNNVDDKSDPGVIQMFEDWPESRFLNEVLSISSDNAEKPLTDDNMRDCCMDYEMFKAPEEIESRKTVIGSIPKHNLVAGIDWGTSEERKSKTVLTIGFMSRDNIFYTLYVKKYSRAEMSELEEVEDIIKTLKKWKIRKVASDWGFGYIQNAKLALALGKKLVIVYTSGSAGHYIMYNRMTKLYTLSRTMSLSRLILDIWHRNIRFFNWEDKSNGFLGMEKLASDFTCVCKEYSERSRTVKYIHPIGSSDDALFSLNYAVAASHIDRGNFEVSDVAV